MTRIVITAIFFILFSFVGCATPRVEPKPFAGGGLGVQIQVPMEPVPVPEREPIIDRQFARDLAIFALRCAAAYEANRQIEHGCGRHHPRTQETTREAFNIALDVLGAIVERR